MNSFFADLRHGLQLLRKAPGFTAVAVITLALGIGATTAVYSVVYGVVLNPFPYKDVDTLMSVRVSEPGQNGGRLYYSPAQFLEIAERNTIFSSTIASTISDILWTSKGEPQRLRGNCRNDSGRWRQTPYRRSVHRATGELGHSPPDSRAGLASLSLRSTVI